jgi:hypothetical protein
LTVLGKTYTHYDLHEENVLVYKPFKGEKYIDMIYHTKDGIFSYSTEYVAKLIDYGRNYFNSNASMNTPA